MVLSSLERTGERIYTIEEVSSHRRAGDFWTVIDNVVYDITEFCGRHPGGDLIICCTGSDGTVNFHQTHVHERSRIKAERMLKTLPVKGRICEADKSPIMGDFYHEVKRRVGKFVDGRPFRPTEARRQFFQDLIGLLMVTVSLIWMLTWWEGIWGEGWHHAPAFSVLWVMAIVLHARLSAWCHAMGHCVIFTPQRTHWGVQLLNLLGGVLMPVYDLPTSHGNFRARTHASDRALITEEFGVFRGPYEHQAVHHVRGAELEHDGCFLSVTLESLFRMNDGQAFRPWHRLQKYRWWFHFVHTVYDVVYMQLVEPLVKLPLAAVWLREGHPARALILVLGMCYDYAIIISYTVVTFYYHPYFFIFLNVVKYYILRLNVALFRLSEHVWESPWYDYKTVKTNWGKYNVETTRTVIPTDMDWHFWYDKRLQDPIGVFFGWREHDLPWAEPQTATFHTEHTLFPTLSYVYYPLIQPIVEQCCKTYGIKYNKTHGFTELVERQYKLCVGMAAAPDARKKEA